MDRVEKRPRGFAFVSYAVEEEAKSAMEGMHGKVGETMFRSLCASARRFVCLQLIYWHMQCKFTVSSAVPGWQSDLCRGCKTKAWTLKDRAQVPSEVPSSFPDASKTVYSEKPGEPFEIT